MTIEIWAGSYLIVFSYLMAKAFTSSTGLGQTGLVAWFRLIVLTIMGGSGLSLILETFLK
jgi:hypothetical protein